MKHVFFSLSTAVGLLSLSLSTFAMDIDNSFEAYEHKVNTKQLPKILIVGCGHTTVYTDGDHTHPDCWCVNVEKAAVQHDAILDIQTPHFAVRNKAIEETKVLLPIRDTISMEDDVSETNIVKYKNKFDVVVLERPLSDTLNKPWTLWNAVHTLKVGGELVIDTYESYSDWLYGGHQVNSQEKMKGQKFSPVCPSTNMVYTDSFNAEKVAKKFEWYGIKEGQQVRENTKLNAMVLYLAHWGLTDILNVKEVYSPYTKTPGGSLETARKTQILSATKTQKTEDEMENWARKIQSIKGVALM